MQESLFPEPSTQESPVLSFFRSVPSRRLENWCAMVADAPGGSVRCAKISRDPELDAYGNLVKFRTMNTIISRNVLSRNEIIHPANCGIDPGWYSISSKSKKMPPRSYWEGGYPDVEVVRPNFHDLIQYEPSVIDKYNCGEFANYCAQVRQMKKYLVISYDKAFVLDTPAPAFNFPFGLKQDAVVNPWDMHLAMIEAYHREKVYITRQVSEERSTPIIIGCNWWDCIIVRSIQHL